jgi:methionine synthase I (cobalamin-dependent)
MIRASAAMEQMSPAGLPLFAAPSAGLPQEDGDRVVYAATPADFADFARRMRDLGVTMIGGCCGTTPAHIACIASAA